MTITANRTSHTALKNYTHSVVSNELLNGKHSIVIIDSGIDHHEILVEGILPTADLLILNQHQDGIAQISAVLSKHPAASIQLIAHGSVGSLQLGNSQLNLDNLHTYRQQLQQWTAAEILIYGCEVAAGSRGQAFIQQLHQITGANIAASTKKIGHSQYGGTWELEVKIGKIATTLALIPEVKEAYPGVLATFGPATPITVGTNPKSVVVQDVNNDGILDIVTANNTSNDVSILLGDGLGGFGAAINSAVGTNPYAVGVGDFDGDGLLDLVTANNTSNDVSILLGDGTGGFGAAAAPIPVGTNPNAVVVGDFNGDTFLDVVTANNTSNDVSLLLGDGKGGFVAAGVPIPVGTNPNAVVVGDFNGDTFLDIVTANNTSNDVSILLGDGKGGFGAATNFTVGTNPDAVAVGDFNGDGILDVVTANNTSNDVSILLGDGLGGFGAATNFTVGTNPDAVVVEDFNGDGFLDVVTANYTSNNVSILLGDGLGGFGVATNFTVGTNPDSLVIGDFNNDKKLDLVTANNASNNVSVLLNTTGINNAPTDLTLSATNVNENVAAATVIGTFTSTDLDVGNTFTYTFVTDPAAPDNNAFTINGNQLTINTSPNFEVKPSYDIKVRTTDNTGLFFDKALKITINDVNETPTDLALSVTSVNDKAAAGTVIGTFTSTDPDVGNTFTYSFVTDPAAPDNNAFTINGNQLTINTSPNFQTKPSYDIKVRTTDNGGLFFDKALKITINNANNVNKAPTDLALSATNVNENVVAGTVIGTFTSTDPDVGNTFTYSFVTDPAAPDNNAFTINGNQLKINTSPNFEAKPNYNIKVRTTDNTGLFFDKALKITINDVNETPTDLALSATSVNDKATVGTVVGTFTSTDPDVGNTFTYSLVTDTATPDNNAFTINGNQLKIQNSPDFQTKASYNIKVRTTDNGGLFFDKALTINVKGGSNPSTTPNNIPSRLTNVGDDVFKIESAIAKTQLQVTVTGSSSKEVNELGLFTVDDAKGTINGIAPGAAGYAQAALERSKIIFSAIANTPNGFSTKNLSSLLELNSGDNLRLVLAKNTSFDAVRTGIAPISELQFANPATQKITNLGDNGFSFDFQGLVVNLKQTNQALPLGTNLQGQFQGEVIDLRNTKQSVKADFTVYREASFNNFVGFYQVADENGGIDTNGDGKADLFAGQAGYTQAAIRGRVAGIDLTVNNQGTATYTGTFKPGAIFAPFIIIDGKPDAILDTNPNNDPAVYFPYLGSNTDKTDHIRLLGSNTFGFEDLPNGGDRDYNDVIVKVNLTPVV